MYTRTWTVGSGVCGEGPHTGVVRTGDRHAQSAVAGRYRVSVVPVVSLRVGYRLLLHAHAHLDRAVRQLDDLDTRRVRELGAWQRRRVERPAMLRLWLGPAAALFLACPVPRWSWAGDGAIGGRRLSTCWGAHGGLDLGQFL